MYDLFTDRARKVMELANDEARRFNHEYIGTEHILLGLVKEGSGRAIGILKELAVDPCKVRLEIEKIIPSGPDNGSIGTRPLTPRAKKVLEHTADEARSLNHNYIDTEHLLLGLMREEGAVAALVLRNLGVQLENVRRGAQWITPRWSDVTAEVIQDSSAEREAVWEIAAQLDRLDQQLRAEDDLQTAALLWDQHKQLRKQWWRIIRKAQQKLK